MKAFLTGPAVLVLVLAVLALEAVAVLALARRRRHAPHRAPLPLTGLLATLAAGAALVGAMLVIVANGPWWGIGVCLGGAFVAHLVDLRDRLRHRGARS